MNEKMAQDSCKDYTHKRYHHPAWLLIASRRAPLVLSCLKPLFEDASGELGYEDASQVLAEMFAEHANSANFDFSSSNYAAEARKELRRWLRSGLVVEREGKLLATDALQKAFGFVDSLEDDSMTSTASRLSTVQREIENLGARLNPEKESRVFFLQKKIDFLGKELERANQGQFDVLEGAQAEEGIREVYQLAISLRADFRRVEDSYRDADRKLRQEIIRSDQNRGGILDKLLDGHDHLLSTDEGQVFDGFYRQLDQSVELDEMKIHLRSILKTPSAMKALNERQREDLRWLVSRLVRESERVIQARARGERDVKGYLSTGMASEHHRVGALLNDLLAEALNVNWSSPPILKKSSVLPPVAVALSQLPLIQRLRFKEPSTDDGGELDLEMKEADLKDVEDDFWNALRGLDRQALFELTVELLQRRDGALSIGDLSAVLPPSHDLETLSYWLGMAREAEVKFDKELEELYLSDESGNWTRFEVPFVKMSSGDIERVDMEVLG